MKLDEKIKLMREFADMVSYFSFPIRMIEDRKWLLENVRKLNPYNDRINEFEAVIKKLIEYKI